MLANLTMARAFRIGNYSVYVLREVGSPHHLPHAHVCLGRARVASVYLVTLQVYPVRARVPNGVLEAIRDAQEELLELWAQLNEQP